MPALTYPTARASATAASVTSLRVSGVIVGAGASSSTFWWRRWVEQSRSKRWTVLPWLSASTCTSMWRPCSTYFSMSMVSSPNADDASRRAAATAASYSSAVRTIRMPLPPPPAAALTSTGKSIAAGSPEPSYDGTTGTPAATAISRAASLRPILSITSALGPTSVMPAASTARAKRGTLGEEAVARVDRVRAGLDRGRDDGVDVEVARDPHRVVGRAHVRGGAVRLGEDRDRADAEVVRRAHDAQRDLATVGDEQGMDHVCHIRKMP